MRRFYAPRESFRDGCITLAADETRHLRDVLRLRVGDHIFVLDGDGHEFNCTIVGVGKKNAELTVNGEIAPTSPESTLDISIAATVLSGEKYDLIIQKSVELGVAELIPLITVRCEVKVKDAAKRLDRWRRIALEATKQCGRAKLMRISEPIGFESLINESNGENLVLFSERDGSDFSIITADKKITALYGPKGGWDDTELDLTSKMGVKIVTLGGRILRAETAAIAITAILQHRFGDLS